MINLIKLKKSIQQKQLVDHDTKKEHCRGIQQYSTITLYIQCPLKGDIDVSVYR